jgi:hypothetical protein
MYWIMFLSENYRLVSCLVSAGHSKAKVML